MNFRLRNYQKFFQKWQNHTNKTSFMFFYTAGICLWTCLSLLFHDRWWWLFLVNSFSIYLFTPLPFLIGYALIKKDKTGLISSMISFLIAVFFFGNLFIPKHSWFTQPEPSLLSVMTFNSLGTNQSGEKTIQAFLESGADVIAIQELNGDITQAIRKNLKEVYPYQALTPEEGTCGTGIISRYPLSEWGIDFNAPGWCPAPQVVKINFHGQEFILINFHAKASAPSKIYQINQETQWRKQQMQEIADYTQTLTLPYVILGDLNASTHSDAYHVITQSTLDVWTRAGWGLGHTFPGGNMPGGGRFKIAGLHIPQWLVRIDYVFISPEWKAYKARIGPCDHGSDHRPVIAEIYLD